MYLRLITLLSVLLPLTTASHAPVPNCPPHPVSFSTQKALFTSFSQKFYILKNATLAFTEHVDPSYIQHNPDFLSGRQIAIDGLSVFLPLVNFTILHSGFVEGNNLAIFNKRDGGGGGDDGKEEYRTGIGFAHYRLDIVGEEEPTAVTDFLRMNGSCIMEHWDVQQVRPANPVNPLALF